MELKITKKDIIWGYFAQFFSITSGIIILPVILKLLSPEEVGLNYLMLTIGTMVTLLDFGFAPQFGRNITYIFSGSQKLLREGVDLDNQVKDINYRLLFVMIQTAKFLYKRLSIFILLSLLTFGTVYIYVVTDEFNSVDAVLPIWVLFCFSTYFNVYYAYYSSLLNGKGLVTEYRKALVYSKVVYTVVAIIMLYSGFGLISIVVANFISPFVARYFSFLFFFTKELQTKLSGFSVERKEIFDLLNIIWHNAHRLGLVYIGSFAITRVGMFIAGLFLSLETIASYGLMIQLVSLMVTVSVTISSLYQPRLASLRMKNDKRSLLLDFSYTLFAFVLLYLIGSIFFISFSEPILSLIGSSIQLPSLTVVTLYCVVVFLETNHSLFSSFIVSNNQIPFVKSTLFAGLLIVIFSYLVLQFTDLQLMGIVLVPGIIQLLYNNWKWPYEVSKYFGIGYLDMIMIGGKHMFNKTGLFKQYKINIFQ